MSEWSSKLHGVSSASQSVSSFSVRRPASGNSGSESTFMQMALQIYSSGATPNEKRVMIMQLQTQMNAADTKNKFNSFEVVQEKLEQMAAELDKNLESKLREQRSNVNADGDEVIISDVALQEYSLNSGTGNDTPTTVQTDSSVSSSASAAPTPASSSTTVRE